MRADRQMVEILIHNMIFHEILTIFNTNWERHTV